MKVQARKVTVKELDLDIELNHTLEVVRQLHPQINKICGDLTKRIKDTFTDASDGEMGKHVLFLKAVMETLKESMDELKVVREFNDKRLFYVLVSRESDGFMAHEKKFRIDGDLLPTPPKKNTPEYEELLEWIRGTEYADEIKPKIEFTVLKKICNELAEKGEKMPPNVKLSTKTKVRVYG